jgi:major inositol transporter-like SP family MFS transporter
MYGTTKEDPGGGAGGNDDDDAAAGAAPHRVLNAAIAIAMIGGFTNGYGASITGGAVTRIEADLGPGAVSAQTKSFLESALFCGMVLGCVFGGWLADRLGRRPSTLLGELCVFAFAAAQALSRSGTALAAFRLLHGFGLGICVLIKPLYVSELVPPSARGLAVGLFAWAYSAGLCIALMLDATIGADPALWRVELSVVPMVMSALLATVVWCCLPESPLFLARRRRQLAAGEVRSGAASAALAASAAAAPPVTLDVQQKRGPFWIWRMLLCGCGGGGGGGGGGGAGGGCGGGGAHSHRTRGALGISALLIVAYQLTGIVLLMTDTRHLLALAQLDAPAVAAFSVGAGVTHFTGVCVAVLLLPHYGRRPLFLNSLLGMSAMLLLAAGCYGASVDGGAALSLSWLPAARGACLLAAVLAFQLGMAPCFWIITTEIFPALDRADAMGAVYSLVFLASTVESALAPLMTTSADVGVFALVSALVGLGAWVWLRKTLPETRHAVVGGSEGGGDGGGGGGGGEEEAAEQEGGGEGGSGGAEEEHRGLLAGQQPGGSGCIDGGTIVLVDGGSGQTADM